MWVGLPKEASFFYKLRHVSRVYRKLNKYRATEYRKEELDLRVELAIATLHDNVYNTSKQGEVMELKKVLEGLETRKTKRGGGLASS